MSGSSTMDFSNNTTTATTNAHKSTGYSMRPRDSIKPPTAFAVDFSPMRARSTKRVNRGYKNTSTVTMPVKVKHDGVTKSKPSISGMSAEQKAAIRAVRLEARNFAKEQARAAGVEDVADVLEGDCDMDDVMCWNQLNSYR